MEQRFTFDRVADLYRASRPEYPEALIDDVLSQADLRATDAVLEVGCGSGQATKSFARRGFRILAIEPGTELVRAARESLAEFANVEFFEGTFEAWPTRPAAFRLLIAAQSWHWVAPRVRFAKAAETLSPGGSLAVFGHVPMGLPAPLLEDLKRIYLRRTGVWGPSPEAWYFPNGPIKGEFDESSMFGPVQHKAYSWVWRHTTSSYTSLLRTRSDYRMLAPEIRQKLLDEVTESVKDHGGKFDMEYETHLYISHRLDRD
jgi:SAM-dependent methyltransferase